MSRGHEQIIASDASHATALDGSAAHRNALTEDVAITNLQARALARILQILRIAADSAKGMQHVGAAQASRAVHDSVSVKNALLAQFHFIADHGISSDPGSGA
jgi:hypothetical protein